MAMLCPESVTRPFLHMSTSVARETRSDKGVGGLWNTWTYMGEQNYLFAPHRCCRVTATFDADVDSLELCVGSREFVG